MSARPRPRLVGGTNSEDRLRRVEEAFASLPERYLGAEEDYGAVVHVRLEDIGRSWEVDLAPATCKVRTPPCRRADVIIGTDTATWLALREGRLSGLDAFQRRRAWARGNIDDAVGFEGRFRLPDDRPPLLRIHDVRVKGACISSLTAGRGSEHVILIHGLGGAKSSFYETVAALTPDYTVHAIDLPGFGSSSKPVRGAYDAGFFARHVIRFMDALSIDRAHLVGNSMGGRVSIEVGLEAPSRVRSLSLLAPSMAWLRGREWSPLVRLLRPELAALPHMLSAGQVRSRFWAMISRPERLDPVVGDIASDEFVRTYRSRMARVAFYKAARNIYLERPHGDKGFWTRLERLSPPALFVWGADDRLVPARFSRHVEAILPQARQAVFGECGHVPQVELPEQTHDLVREFIESASGTAGRMQRTGAASA
ncbi:MAG TPA: alpha/beta fold hydrolase [Solirubrobacterales bacterium]|nr:alpha/beta fold hydrolase [Solirubrobacterales bacterium]